MGKGPIPMILIPTIGTDWADWESFMARNESRYTMYAVTLPGMVGTVAPELFPGETWEQMVLTENAERAVATLIADRSIDRPVIMGHGYGGHLALRFALKHPEQTRGVISLDAMPLIPFADPNRVESTLEERLDIIKRVTARELLTDPDDVWREKQFQATLFAVSDQFHARDYAVKIGRTDRAVLVFYYFEQIVSDVRAKMNSIQVPVLFVAPIPAEAGPMAEITREQWVLNVGNPPNTTLAFYPGAKHMVMHDAPAQLDQDVALFVAGEVIPGARRSFGRDTPAVQMPGPVKPADAVPPPPKQP